MTIAITDPLHTTDLVPSVVNEIATAKPATPSGSPPTSSKPICVGGGQTAASAFSTDPADYVLAFGYSWNPQDPFAQVYPLIMAQYRPTGHLPGGSWDALCEACMRTRNMLFCNKVPYDCLAGPVAAGTGNEKLIGALGSAGLQIASVFVPIPGAGILLNQVLSIFSNHAQAEARQSNTLCQVCGPAGSAIQSLDAAVASRSASPSQGYQSMVMLQDQFIGALAGIYKNGNAADGYDRIMKCQTLLSSYGYGLTPLPNPVELSPAVNVPSTEQLSVVGAPINIIPAAPSSLVNNTEVSTTPAPSSLIQAATTVGVGSFSSSTLLIIAVVIAILWGLLSGAL